MANTENETPNPYTRPWFLLSALLVVAVIVAAIAVITVTGRNEAQPPVAKHSAPSTAQATNEPASSESPAPAEAEGPCPPSLAAPADAKLTAPPKVTWEQSGLNAYPASEEHGPKPIDGIRTCYSHTPEGALLSATSATVYLSDSEQYPEWLEWGIAQGPKHDAYVEKGKTGAETELRNGQGSVRLRILGYKLLEYTGDTAYLDIAAELTTSEGDAGYIANTVHLVWQNGDWRIDIEQPEPMTTQVINNIRGYTTWGE